jgi:hypothetical protein
MKPGAWSTKTRPAMDELIASLDAGAANPNADSLWATEIDRRVNDLADGKVSLVDADEVHAEAARRLRARAGR